MGVGIQWKPAPLSHTLLGLNYFPPAPNIPNSRMFSPTVLPPGANLPAVVSIGKDAVPQDRSGPPTSMAGCQKALYDTFKTRSSGTAVPVISNRIGL